ncbi:MAG: DUF3822 family protein [Bacteroidetes bacterium]|nr:MAG: DUF3822 family protein [Bacteroidota bacterium]
MFFSSDEKEIDVLQNISFNAAYLSHITNKVTLIPTGFYDEKHQNELFSIIFGKTNHPIKTNLISELDIITVFESSTSLQRKYSEIYCQTFCWLEYLLYTIKKNHLTKNVFIHLEKTFFHIAFFQNKQLKFYNTFETNHWKDIIYFILYVYNRLNLSQTEVSLIYSGSIKNNEKLFSALKEYIATVQPISIPDFINYPADFPKAGVLAHIPLFAQYLCE